MLSEGNVGFPSSKVGKKTPPSILVEFFFNYINKQDWVTNTDRVPAETILWLGQESILLVPLPLQVLARKIKLEKLSKKWVLHKKCVYAYMYFSFSFIPVYIEHIKYLVNKISEIMIICHFYDLEKSIIERYIKFTWSMIWTSRGHKNAAVLPLPVLAIPMMSRPLRASGIPCNTSNLSKNIVNN